jgi:hypothetical protein
MKSWKQSSEGQDQLHCGTATFGNHNNSHEKGGESLHDHRRLCQRENKHFTSLMYTHANVLHSFSMRSRVRESDLREDSAVLQYVNLLIAHYLVISNKQSEYIKWLTI